MPFSENNHIRYYTFDIFPHNVLHGVISRHGGSSPAPWDSLNVGGTVGDDRTRVRENRARSFAAFGRDLASIFDVWQVHSADVVYADAPINPDTDLTKADIILTDKPEVTLFMRFADCVPILLHDPKKNVIGIAHAGWMGTVRGAGRAAIEGMQLRYGSKPEDILAAIGPSIGPDHYEVGADVIEQVNESFGEQAKGLIEMREGRTYLDLWKANQIQLQNAGVQQIEVAGLCTACHLDDWYSHRAEKGKTGRFSALMALNGK
ncbi:MAG TPA: peptidoglycan editing factor PgeF [Anaerolineales bacterium]|nr:peptidoglycan editing factor PgeF [Anaerolineales bacterium]